MFCVSLKHYFSPSYKIQHLFYVHDNVHKTASNKTRQEIRIFMCHDINSNRKNYNCMNNDKIKSS